jgi:excisionase family DNA binding protein
MSSLWSSTSLTEAQAAAYLGISVSSIRKSRMNGTRDNHLPPPPFVKLGRRVIYREADLHAYLEAHLAPQR